MTHVVLLGTRDRQIGRKETVVVPNALDGLSSALRLNSESINCRVHTQFITHCQGGH